LALPDNDVPEMEITKEPMPDKLQEELYVALIDIHFHEVKTALDVVKKELSVNGIDTLAFIRKGEVLKALLDELNVMVQHKKKIGDRRT
jgi:hypothetical protein